MDVDFRLHENSLRTIPRTVDLSIIPRTIPRTVDISKAVEICSFKKTKHHKLWLVQLPIGTKRNISELVEKCPLEMGGLSTCANLNILPLGTYDILIRMDWLEAH